VWTRWGLDRRIAGFAGWPGFVAKDNPGLVRHRHRSARCSPTWSSPRR
jgi:hypothetical protein